MSFFVIIFHHINNCGNKKNAYLYGVYRTGLKSIYKLFAMGTSFVEIYRLTKVSSIKVLDKCINDCRKFGYPLHDLDLEGLDLRNIDMSNLHIQNVLFNRFDPTKTAPKEIFNINFKGCTFEKVCFSYCKLVRCNFDSDKTTKREAIKRKNFSNDDNETALALEHPAYLNEVDFFFCQFDTCRFRNTKFNIIDFRYSRFTDCSLGGCDIYVGDFYMASFCGTTNFYNSKFRSCSLTNTTFEQHCPSIFNIDKLAQENYQVYHDIIIGAKNWSKHNPCAGYSHVNEAEDNNNELESQIHNHHEAYRVYATLSGIYNGKGFFRESNQAYRLAKWNEAKYNMLAAKKCRKDHNYKQMFRHLWKRFTIGISWCFGYGYKIPYVLFWICVLVMVFGVFYKYKEQLEQEHEWSVAFARSLNNTLGPFDKFTSSVGEWCGSMQSTVGILLVGFMGFIIANRIRNNA